MGEMDASSGRLPYAKSFKELVVYRKARALAREVFEITRRFPKDEAYALTDQLRRSVRSIGAQIAEAWSRRRYPRHFASKLTDAEGEQNETQHWIITALDCDYLSREEAIHLGEQAKEIGAMLGSMIRQAEQFNGNSEASDLKEDHLDYQTEANVAPTAQRDQPPKTEY